MMLVSNFYIVFYVHYFHKTPVPTEKEKMPDFIHLLAKCGVKYTYI